MKISTINNIFYKNISSTQNKKINFKGLTNIESPCMFVFDLDGTFAHGTTKDIQKIINLKKQKNATLVYATGRNLDKFSKLQNDLAQKGVKLPLPDYLIARNGLFVYKNVDEKLIEDADWIDLIYKDFPKDKILNLVKDFAFTEQYALNSNGKKPTKFEESKLCQFEFWGSDRMLQFVCDNSIDKKTEQTLNKVLKENNINATVLRQEFPKWMWDKLSTPEQLTVVNPRYNGKDYCTQIDILPKDKADAVKFIQTKKLNLPNEEVLIAGNDDNDITMAKLSSEGINFIALANSSERLREICKELQKQQANVYIAQKEGTKGILEGIGKISKTFA